MSNASFANKLASASASTVATTSAPLVVTGIACVTTRIRRSPSLDVYSNALCTVTNVELTLCSSWLRSKPKTLSLEQLGSANRSVPRTKKLP